MLEEAAAGGVEDEVAFEPLIGEAIDIGEAVAQEFSLALPRFPRSAGADGATDAARRRGARPVCRAGAAWSAAAAEPMMPIPPTARGGSWRSPAPSLLPRGRDFG